MIKSQQLYALAVSTAEDSEKEKLKNKKNIAWCGRICEKGIYLLGENCPYLFQKYKFSFFQNLNIFEWELFIGLSSPSISELSWSGLRQNFQIFFHVFEKVRENFLTEVKAPFHRLDTTRLLD